MGLNREITNKKNIYINISKGRLYTKEAGKEPI
jgi:hypothetical protein